MTSNSGHVREWRRRDVLGAMSAAGAAALLGLRSTPAQAEPPPETTSIRINDAPIACFAPLYVARELLKLEGFKDIQYVNVPLAAGPSTALARGEVDFIMDDPPAHVLAVNGGSQVVLLNGMHTGCWELFGSNEVRSLHDLKGKKIAAPANSSRVAFVAAMLVAVGLNPDKDVIWIDHEPGVSMKLFIEGKVDAFMGFAPEPQELRARGIGHVLVDTLTDRPWSQYFCCMLGGRREFVSRYPVATRRAVRAFIKAAELCVSDPEAAAQIVVKAGVSEKYEYVLKAVREIGYRNWRIYEPEDTVRFWALRLREAGMISASPKKIIDEHCDWRFSNELKRELKA